MATVQSITPETEQNERFEIRDDLETAVGKLGALEHLLARLADAEKAGDLTMRSLEYTVEALKDEFQDIFDRLHAFDTGKG